jgi:hypothetical protein
MSHCLADVGGQDLRTGTSSIQQAHTRANAPLRASSRTIPCGLNTARAAYPGTATPLACGNQTRCDRVRSPATGNSRKCPGVRPLTLSVYKRRGQGFALRDRGGSGSSSRGRRVAPKLKSFNGGGYKKGVRSSPVLARKLAMRPRRCCIRVSRVFSGAIGWPRLRSAGLAGGPSQIVTGVRQETSAIDDRGGLHRQIKQPAVAVRARQPWAAIVDSVSSRTAASRAASWPGSGVARSTRDRLAT